MGVGDLTDLQTLLTDVAGLGGTAVATLPLLATFTGAGEPFEPSPYAPASRLFWNELYLDVTKAPELVRSSRARRLLDSTAVRAEVAALESSGLVDYRRAVALKRRILEALAETFFAEPSARRNDFERFERETPAVIDYARFRAATERHGAPWTEWPKAERDGRLPRRPGDGAERYHRYVQWLAAEQLETVAAAARSAGAGLYFDLPLGAHPAGYDVWRERRSFVVGATAGAPPDSFFTAGQDWGFPPLHPERIREDGYRYSIACIRHLLRHATLLRIDHVMGLHRVYFVPRGSSPEQGVYVGYRPEELSAILSLEASRAGAMVVGEDLGTVPRQVRASMRRHGFSRSFVVQEEVRSDPRAPLPRPPRDAIASLNTHDMPTFASFWRGKDIQLRVRHGWLDRAEAEHERARRRRLLEVLAGYLRTHGWLAGGADGGRAFERKALRACLALLAAGESRMVTVNLGDLWLETEPQNVPGTTDEHPNWRRRLPYSLQELRRQRDVVGTLRDVDRRRRTRDGRP